MMASYSAFKSFGSSCFQKTAAFLANSIYQIFRRFVIWIVSAGSVPNHVAIIMDGNRRYATKRNAKKLKGHEFGYNSLMHNLRDCYELGIKYEKLELLIEKGSIVNKYGIRVQIIGDLSLFPQHVREAAERAMAFSRNNDRAVLNICAPYTGTQEIAQAIEGVINNGDLAEKEIRAEDIERHLYTSNCPEPELLIRTSGETRLSNFFLWQTSFSLLYATPTLWPEFTFRHLIRAILEYQRAYPFLQKQKDQLLKLVSHQHHD
ncbi:hypothetical protein SUGI_0534940 [Cryptomeria japonica]|uniref:dehydrodolichyl diphosphate synthase CPT3 isoform X2 n=1 Tax=Cryptomeria japonica TaxID=3369 RepID=UPI0024089C65|nr:dehydrodolichyl diphosphate synthase CPT3 isoform X2 [Cryptomeria japonica]GLJ27261.1 hypothetical protein SUGI_0534940 [Cryptomeria japonica]